MIHRYSHGLLTWLVLLGLTVPLWADEGPTLPAESRVSEGRYAEARKQLADGKGSQAVEVLQELIDGGGDSLVALDRRQSVQARLAAQVELSRLGRKTPEALQQVRQRIDEQAQRRLKEALAGRDEGPLRALVEEMFCSTAAVQALDRLGDQAFERGRFAEAVAWWRQLAPWPEYPAELLESGTVLVHPGPIPRATQARVHAKQMLARLFAGGDDGWQADLRAFRARHADAGGKLAGRSGSYAAILTEVAGQLRPRLSEGWRTFAGSPTRQHVVPADEEVVEHLSGLCRDGPAWTINLEERARLQEPLPPYDGNVPDSQQARTLAFHPLLIGSQLIVADACFVTAFDLRTGKSSEWYDVTRFNGGVQPPRRLPAPPDLRYTLSAGVDCIYARLGVQGLRPEEVKGAPEARPEQPQADNESFLVCLNLTPDRGGNRERWCLRGRMHGVVYEGAPVVGEGNLYVAATRFRGDRVITSIDCYAADTPGEPPLRWRRDVCNSRAPRGDAPRYRHHLLTLAAGQVVYCSDSGVIAAVDAASGHPSWAVRYPRQDDGGEERPPLRDLTPPVFAEGRLYAAPTDSDHLLCLDPLSGRSLWQREGLQVVHVLGVGQGRLIFATREGLRAVGAADGADASGWALPDAGGELLPMGRGLLVGDVVLWPTARVRGAGFPARRIVYAVRQRDGRPADDPALLHNLPAGNLLYANGCLVSCGARTASVFVPPAWRLPQRRQQAEEHPRSPRAALALARAQADAGQVETALNTLKGADELARAQPGRLFLSRVEDERERILRGTLTEAAQRGRREEAEQWARQLEQCRDSPGERVRALLRLAALWERAGQPVQALKTYQHLLRERKLGDILVHLDTRPARAADHVRRQLERLRRAAPEAFTEVMEAPARRLWEQDGESEATRCLRLVQEFPHTETAQVALRRMLQKERAAGHWGAAAQALRLLLAEASEEREREELRRELAAVSLKERESSIAASSVEKGQSLTSQALPSWQRAWHVTLPAGQSVLPVLMATAESPWIITSGAGTGEEAPLGCRSLETGKERWAKSVPLHPLWAASHSDLVLALGGDGVACLRQEDGATVWQLLLAEHDRGEKPLGDFQLAAGRLFCRWGDTLLALDVECGRVLWQQAAPGEGLDLPFPAGRVFAHYHAGPRTVLLQTSGRRLLLDAASGKCLHVADSSPEPWPRPVVPVDEAGLCIVADLRHVLLVDAGDGREKWRFRLPGGSMLDGRPAQVVSRGSVLLVLVSTNVGQLLYRFDPDTGKMVWTEPLYLGLPPLETADWAIDERTLTLARAGRLESWSLDEPRLLWKQPLLDGRDWQVRKLGEGLLVSPVPEPDSQIQLRCFLGALQWNMTPLAPAETSCPLECREPTQGQLVQRLNFRARLPVRWEVSWRTTGKERGFSLGPGVSFPLAASTDAVMHWRLSRGAVALGAEVWGLRKAFPTGESAE